MAMWEGKDLLDIKWSFVGRGQELNGMGGYVEHLGQTNNKAKKNGCPKNENTP